MGRKTIKVRKSTEDFFAERRGKATNGTKARDKFELYQVASDIKNTKDVNNTLDNEERLSTEDFFAKRREKALATEKSRTSFQNYQAANALKDSYTTDLIKNRVEQAKREAEERKRKADEKEYDSYLVGLNPTAPQTPKYKQPISTDTYESL